MRLRRPVGAMILVAGCAATGRDTPKSTAPSSPVASSNLQDAAAFAGISDPAERSRALFVEASRVLLHPRCLNCHPDGDSPYQRSPPQLHDPPVTRGVDDRGVVGMRCNGCHQDQNIELAGVPGVANWRLAPREMAWVGKTPAAVCEQLKDPKRNGGHTLEQIVDHNRYDELVGWGWRPGSGREPVPGTQAAFGALIAEWVRTGAYCPVQEARR